MIFNIPLSTLVLLTLQTAAPPAKASPLPVLKKAPDFSLVDQANKKVSLGDFKGKVVLATFIFTTCTGNCPATTHRVAAIQRELAKRHVPPSELQILAFTLDPAKDTPPVLRDYMELFDLPAAYWKLLTGPPDQVHRVNAAWGMALKPPTKDQPDHPSLLYLVDRHGRIRQIINLETLRLPRALEDIGVLLKEK